MLSIGNLATAYNPTALMQTVQTFRKRRTGLSATAGLSC